MNSTTSYLYSEAPQSKSLPKFMAFLLCLLAPLWSAAQNCSVNAGTTQNICTGQMIQLTGNIGGPFDPNTLIWSLSSQPAGANIIINNPASLSTNAGIANIAGTYVFKISVTCGDAVSTSDSVIINVNPTPNMPIQSGNSTFTCYTGAPITITGTAPLAGQTVSWLVPTGMGTFSNPTAHSTTFTPIFPPDDCAASFKIDITYRVQNANGCFKSVVKQYTFARKFPFFAIADPSPVCGNSVMLKGSCAAGATALWSTVSIPAGASSPQLLNASSNVATATNLVPGTYTFKYLVSGSCGTDSSNVTVVVAASAGVSTADAGKDQYFCNIPGSIALTGNLVAAGEIAEWTQIGGGNAVSFSNASNHQTLVSGLSNNGAPYTFMYRILTAGGCFTKDTIVVYVEPSLSISNFTGAACGAAALPNSGTTSNRLARLGNFQFNQLDTVSVSITYVSGPAPTSQAMLYGGSSLNALVYANNNVTLAVGQTFTQTLWNTGNASSPHELYLNRGNSPNSNAYYLFFNNNVTAVGTYKYSVTYTTKCSTYVAEITTERGVTTAVNAGTDIALACNVNSATLAGNIMDGFAFWTTISKPAGATDPINLLNRSLKNPPLNALIPGTYVFRYSSDAGKACFPSTDDVQLIIASAPPPIPDAGADATVCAGTTTLNASAIPAGALATWSVISPAGALITFSNINYSTSLISGLLPNTTYVFRYTLSNGCGSNFDEVSIQTTANNSPGKPVITVSDFSCAYMPNFGPFPKTINQVLKHPALSGTQTGTVSVVSVPPGSLTSWTQIASTDTTNTLQITLNNEATLSYIFCVSDNADCSGLTLCDTATYYFFDNLAGAAISAGPDQNLCSTNSFPATTLLSGTPTVIAKKWSLYYSSNGLSPVINDSTNATTSVDLPAEGLYTFKYELVGTDPTCQPMFDYVSVVVSAPGSLAYAGADTTICNASGEFNLNALPLISGTGKWEIAQILSGSVPVISDITSAQSLISFAGSGSVVLRWSSYGNNVACGPSSSDLMELTYIAPAYAGNDTNLCASTLAYLQASNPQPSSGQWTQISGPNVANIADSSNHQTMISGLTSGTYTFQWTVSNAGNCTTSDLVDIHIQNLPTSANAGPDQMVCAQQNTSIGLNALSLPQGYTGQWSVFSIPAAALAGNFTNDSDPSTTYAAVSAPGHYIFSWTISNQVCSSSDFVDVNADTALCIGIYGNVFHDINANTLIDTNESTVNAGAAMYIYLIDSSGNVIDSTTVLADGSFILQGMANTAYSIIFSVLQYSIGTNINLTPIDSAPPAGWYQTGENGDNNTGTGDGEANGVLNIVTGNTDFTNANFGLKYDSLNLPAVLLSFEISSHNCNATLAWQCVQEQNVAVYELQRKDKLAGFRTVSNINSLGYSKTPHHYQWTDYLTEEDIYEYRLKIVDIDGQYEIGPTKAAVLDCQPANEMFLFPNPSASNVQLSITTEHAEAFEIKVTDIVGKTVFSTTLELTKHTGMISIPSEKFASGIYHVTVTSESNSQVLRLIRK